MSKRFTFATGANADYIEELYQAYRQDPNAVDESWKKFFEGYEFAAVGVGNSVSIDEAQTHAKVEAFVNAYRRLGHLCADVNPLSDKPALPETMGLSYHGLSDADLETTFHPANFGEKARTLKEIKASLEKTYTGRIGADYRDINAIDEVEWLQEKMESCENNPTLSPDLRKRLLNKLTHAETFEKFLGTRYLGQKRFSLEGLDALVPMLDVIINEVAANGGEELCLGMAHRGRLNVLTNTMGKPLDHMLSEFEGSEYNPFDIDGDVKYHMGYGNILDTSDGTGKKVRLYLSPNPSHLEVVNPVVEGFVRCRQRLVEDKDRKKVIPVLLHGDAAFIGQGVVSETLNLSQLDSYKTGGTIHIITNNQVGFTTDFGDSRSCEYSSDIAKGIRAPVIHVNADDPDACAWAGEIAAQYRQKFHKDVVIDLIGYRRHGHNEGDEPSFTQPQMYKQIKKHETVMLRYRKKLVAEKVLTEADAKKYEADFRDELQAAFEKVKAKEKLTEITYPKEFDKSLTARKVTYSEALKTEDTKVKKAELMKVGEKITHFPDSFNLHPKLKRIFAGRAKMLEGEGAIDWGLGELLAYGTLAVDGHHVRLSGQDCKRGTFSSRHGVTFDYETGEEYEILNHIEKDKQEPVDIINSPLSEMGCLGYEFGYSVADHNSLVLWEGQFGDFVNGAQIVIDQFLAASEAKWKQTSGLVLLLPHGYEGQGPEHSSARPERFLQLCGYLNFQVCNVTTPAQLFHMLRRQVNRDFRKPLIVMTPKSLLRHPKVVSPIRHFTDGHFYEMIDDPEQPDPNKVTKLLWCTGKIFYDLMALREEGKGNGTEAIIRVEQLYPFSQKTVKSLFAKYKNAKEIVWVQEEPQNMGAWSYIRPRFEAIFREEPGRTLSYVGRKYSGTTAEGNNKAHQVEQRRILEEAFGAACGWEPKKNRA